MIAFTALKMQRQPRVAFTLLEVLVVLIILSLGAALVIPVVRPTPERGDAARALVEQARGIAVQRGQHLILRIATDGNWTLRTDGAPDSERVATGHLTLTHAAALSARFTPFGGCSSLLGADLQLDALRCRSIAAAGGTR